MKSIAVVAVSILVLAGSVAAADARGFRLRSTSFSVPYGSTSYQGAPSSRLPAVAPLGAFDPSPDRTSVATRSVMTTDGLGAGFEPDENGPIPPMPPMPPATSAVTAKKPAEPWCPSGRIAGSGTGFCLIN